MRRRPSITQPWEVDTGEPQTDELAEAAEEVSNSQKLHTYNDRGSKLIQAKEVAKEAKKEDAANRLAEVLLLAFATLPVSHRSSDLRAIPSFMRAA